MSHHNVSGVLAALTITQWSGRKLDKKATAKATQEAGAASDRLRVHKSLVDREVLAPLAKIARAARAYHDSVTVPWTYDGVAMLPSTLLLEYDQTMAKFQDDFRVAQGDLRDAYRDAVMAAAKGLGSAFNINEYPHIDDIIARFTMRVTLSPLPSAMTDDFRVAISDEVADRIAEDVRGQYKGMVEAMRQDLANSAARVYDRLKAYDDSVGNTKVSAFRNSLLETLLKRAEVLRQANIVHDPKLKAALGAMFGDAALCLDSNTLRSDAAVRDHTLRGLKKVIDELEG